MRIPYRLTCHVISLTLFSGNLFAQGYSALPEAPSRMPVQNQITYYLTIVVNGRYSEEVVPVLYRNKHYFVEADVLIRNHVRVEGVTSGLVNVSTLPDVTTVYASKQQQLQLTVPSDWLPLQEIDSGNYLSRYPARSSVGFLQNYDAYYVSSHNNTSALSTFLEQRLFSNYGYLTNSGIYRKYSHAFQGESGYMRYDSFWRYSDESKMLSVQVGDFISNSLTWSNSNRMGGVRISRNFGLRPDLVTYPLLQYSGNAAVPSSVDLFINGYRASSTNIDPGPFNLNNTPYINGRGEATIVTTDALGRQVQTTIPFYVSNTLLKQGLSDFDFSLGALRRNYGLRQAEYGNPALSGFYRYGLTNTLTVSGHTELAKNVRLFGAGIDVTPGYWGTTSLSYSHSNSDIDGQKQKGYQYTAGYSYYSATFGFAAQHIRRNAQFQDISSASNDFSPSRQISQLTFSTSPFGKNGGAMSIGYFDLRDSDNRRTRLSNLSYSVAVGQHSNLSVSLNKAIGERGVNAMVQLNIPFDTAHSTSASIQRNNDGRLTTRIDASRSAPSDGGLSWNAGYSAGANHYRSGSLGWKGRYANVQGGIYGNAGDNNYWGSLSGSLIMMDNAWFASNKVNDAFILVSTEGYKDVAVRYENQYIGKTDKNGHLLIPWVSAYHPGFIEIGTMNLPVNIQTPQVEQRIAVRESSGTLASFPIYKMRPVMVRLTDKEGKFIPIGSRIRMNQDQETSVVGYDGLAFFAHTQPHNQLVVTLPDNQHCLVSFSVPETNATIPEIGPLICQKPVSL